MTLAHGSNRGSKISARPREFQRTDFAHQSEVRPDLTIYGLQGRFSHGVARNAGVSVEYRYRTGEFGYAVPTTEHGVDVGLEYSRPLSVSRRAVFRFDVGSSTLDTPESAVPAVVKGRQDQLLGCARTRLPVLADMASTDASQATVRVCRGARRTRSCGRRKHWCLRAWCRAAATCRWPRVTRVANPL